MKQWYMLMLAIIAEVTGTTMLKFVGQNESLFGYVLLLAMIGFSYFLLSKAVVKIPLSIAYATWEGIGLIAITIIGWVLFNEKLPIVKVLGITAILAGIILLKNGMIKHSTVGDQHE